MFIIFVIFLTTVFVHSHEKYIDLLPEEEKQEFLEQVARRIMQNVESKENKEKFSRELTDEQLKEHDYFVQKILKQESEQMRRKGDDEHSGEEKSSDEHLEVKPLQIDSAGTDKLDTPEAEQVDFTLNNIKRRSFDASPPINTTDDAKVGSIAEDLPVHKRSIQSGESENEEASTKKQDEETKTEVYEHIESTKFRDLTVVKTNYSQSTTLKSDTREATTVDTLNYEKVASLESAHQLVTTENSRRSQDFDKSGESVAALHTDSSTSENIATMLTSTTARNDVQTQATDLKTDSPKSNTTESSITYINMNKRNISGIGGTHATDNYKEITTVSSFANESNEQSHSTTYAPVRDTDYNTLSSTLSDEGTTQDTTETTTYESDSDLTTDRIETTTESQKHVGSIEKHEEDTNHEDLIEKHGEVTEKNEELAGKDEVVTEKGEEVTEKDEDVTENDEEVTEKGEEVTEKDEDVTEKDEEVTKKDEMITEKEDEVIEKDEEATENTPLVNSATTENYKSQTEASTGVIENSTITTTDLPIPALTPMDIEEITTKKPKKSKHKHTKINEGETETAVSIFSSSTLKKVKTKIKTNKFKLKKYKDINKSNIKQNPEDTYRVYEVHWPPLDENESPFLRSPNPMIDQPYMVPIYNYSPNNAYYNPQNRLGPNAVERNSIEQDMNTLREGKDDDDTHAVKPEFILDLDIELMKKFGKYISRPKQYQLMRPDSNYPKKKKRKITTTSEESEESSADEIRLPDTHEVLLPYNNINSGLKSQIRAIRDVLFHNKHFGDKGEHNEYDDFLQLPKKMRSGNATLRHRYDKDRLIDLDYFFGRAYPRDKARKVARQKDFALRSVDGALDEVKMFFINVGDRFQNLVHPNRNVKKHPKNIYDDINQNKAFKRYRNYKDKVAHSKNAKKVKGNGRVDTISKILNMTDEADMFVNLNKMQSMNMKMRRNDDAQFGKYVMALKQMIVEDNKALKQYDWLASTVQIQSGLSKLLELIQLARESKPIHPADIQIWKYVVFLHNFATEIRQANHLGSKLRKKLILPKNKKKHSRFKVLKEKGLLNRVWLYLRTLLPDLTAKDGLSNVHEFLLGVQDGLFDLHEAIKQVASVTKYSQQNWYKNLKDLYLTSNEKQVREVLLHITFARLVGLIEYSCQNGLDDDFIKYMKSHRNIAKTTLEETLFALKIVDEINNNFV